VALRDIVDKVTIVAKNSFIYKRKDLVADRET